MAIIPSDLNIADLTIQDLKIPFHEALPEGQTMRFVNIQKGGRQLLIKFRGRATSTIQKFADNYSFFLEPDSTEIQTLSDIELFFQNMDVNNEAERYKFRSVLNDHNALRIKMKSNDKGQWLFLCNDKTFTKESDLSIGTEITVTLNCGYWFNDETELYGMFLSLKNLEFVHPKKVVRKR